MEVISGKLYPWLSLIPVARSISEQHYPLYGPLCPGGWLARQLECLCSLHLGSTVKHGRGGDVQQEAAAPLSTSCLNCMSHLMGSLQLGWELPKWEEICFLFTREYSLGEN